MQEMFADLHVHIGRSENGKPIKITAARSLNFANIAKECAERKGIQIVGIIDCASPYVIEDIEKNFPVGVDFDIKGDYFLRNALGSIVKYIISDFGYEVYIQREINKGTHIKSATVYKFNPKKVRKSL